ncbi:MAG: bifunctional proline dehydrogenase/L-glutamate gamma-semialdehyde dehydrogenase, partial [Marinovum sp.]|nr:bifunctional proline dehydrogenase/L-glutamate gamma-semialdehyde dehydrogenase [Marinovum sp.]
MDHASLPILPQRAQINYSQQAEIIAHLIKRASLTPAARAQISRNATNMVQRIRAEGKPGLIESFLAEYGLSSAEGIALMRLAEALLRVPDAATIDALVTDKIAPGNWASHCGHAASALVNASTLGLWSTGQVLSLQSPSTKQSINRAIQRLGAPVIRLAMTRAMKEMGRQFVLGETIEAALRTSQGMQDAQLHSFDMLGEAACTKSDADRYYTSYRQAIEKIARASNTRNTRENPGISVKLSALHPRYEVAQTARVIAELVPKLRALAIAAKTAAIGLTVDAEEANRLVLSLAVIEQVLATPELAGWDGFGVVVQAYGPRASGVIDHLYNLAKRHDRQIAIRLVKGAYWDSEIKQAQLDGLSGFPVFTAKAATDISYIANVRKLFSMTDRIYPQFATHNAHTIAAILHMAPNYRCFEFQRLHGMGAALHGLIRATHATQCRIYAPVGAHRDLLAYLVRRLLENGANSSFVNQIVDPEIPPEQVAADPFSSFDFEQRPLPLGTALFHPRRQNSRGFDLSDGPTLAAIEQRRGLFHKTQWNSQPLLAGLPCPEHSQICNNPAV